MARRSCRGGGYFCDICGESYDAGERHECEGPPQEREPERPRRVDKHLEACRRAGQYVQPGFRLGYKRS